MTQTTTDRAQTTGGGSGRPPERWQTTGAGSGGGTGAWGVGMVWGVRA
jgi:hypothetical protein